MNSKWIKRFAGLPQLKPSIKDILICRSSILTAAKDTILFGPRNLFGPGKSPAGV